MAYIKQSTRAIRRPWTLRGHLRGLGVTSALVGGTLTYGPSLTSTTARRTTGRPLPIGPARPPIFTPVTPISNPAPWGGNPPRATPLQNGQNWWQQNGQNGQGGGGNGGWSSDNPANSNNLAQLVLQYQSNPSSLTAQQWQQLQAAGVIPTTVPYSNASLVNPTSSSSAIDPATGVPYATEIAEAQAAAATTTTGAGLSTSLSALYAGIPLYIWLGGGALLFIVMRKR